MCPLQMVEKKPNHVVNKEPFMKREAVAMVKFEC